MIDPLTLERQRAAYAADDACTEEHVRNGEQVANARERMQRIREPAQVERSVSRIAGEVLLADVSLKRIAWAYGCAKKGSEEEQRLHEALLRKALAVVGSRGGRERHAAERGRGLALVDREQGG